MSGAESSITQDLDAAFIQVPRPSVLRLIGGALRLQDETFRTLRERSDVFYRGFLVVLLVGLLAGAFEATRTLIARSAITQTEEQAITQALRGFENSYNGPLEVKQMISSYIREGVAIGYEIPRLPPRAGEEARPLVNALEWLGRTLSFPFADMMPALILGGLLVQLASRWLGGRATIAQMLGLTALAYAPDLLRPVTSLLLLGQTLSGSGAFGGINSLVALVLAIWRIAIYVKATSVAQQFSIRSAILAIIIAAVLVIVIALVLAIGVYVVFGVLLASIVSANR